MKTKSELREERGQMLESAQGILDRADGMLNDADAVTVKSLMDKADAIDRLIASSEMLDQRKNKPDNPEIRDMLNNFGGSMAPSLPHAGENQERGRGPVFKDANGREIQAKTSSERFSAKPSNGQLGESIHNMLTGNIQNSQVGSTDSAGGYLLTPSLSDMVIDLARSASVCMRAGALTLPMSTSEMSIVGVASDATPVWRSEAQAITSSVMTFNRINMRARTLAAIVPVSIEMLEDAANASAIIEAALAAALGQKLDKAGLYGTGSGAEPQGIKYASGTNSVTSVGTPTAGAATYAKPITGIKNILDANYPGETSGLSWIQNPRDFANWNGLSDSTYQPLMAPKIVADMKQFTTTALPKTEGGGGAESSAIIGDFSQLVFGMRTSGVVIQILDSGTVSDGTDEWNAVSQMLKFIRIYLRADVALLRPSWFSVLSGITSA